jgi:putative membrane protein
MRIGIPFAGNPLLRLLVAAFVVLWILAGLQPVDRQTWLLENVLALLLLAVLAATHRRFVFSDLSSLLIFAYLVLHVVGSHYTYSVVPAGEALRDLLGLDRNPYDRIVHFAFGLLLAYPIRELLLRTLHLHGRWGFAAPPVVVLALGSLYEILESWAARIVDPGVGLAFVGAQGDVWDGQKDMSLAFAGSVLAMALCALVRERTGREPYLWRSAVP